MDKTEIEPSPSPTIDICTTEKSVIFDNVKENKNSKFLSIDDILVRNTVQRRTEIKLNMNKDYIPAMESQTLRETNGESEGCEQEMRHNFDKRVTACLIGFDDVSCNQQHLSVLQPLTTHGSRTDVLKEDAKYPSDIKVKEQTSEACTPSSAAGELSTEWWPHPLWRQIYETKILQESQPSLTKLLLPSYLMMSKHVLGARLSFHPSQVESSSESPAVNFIFNGEQGDESKGLHSLDKFTGHEVQNAEPTSDEGSVSGNTGLSHTPPAVSHPAPSKPKRRRQRQAYTITQLNTLEEEFKNNRYLSSEKRESMSQVLGLSENQVKAWFQNRRTKHKKQLTQHINQLNTSHQTSQREDIPLSQPFQDPTSFVFTSAQHPFTSIPMVPPIQLHGLSSFLSRSYPNSTSYLSLLQKML